MIAVKSGISVLVTEWDRLYGRVLVKYGIQLLGRFHKKISSIILANRCFSKKIRWEFFAQALDKTSKKR